MHSAKVLRSAILWVAVSTASLNCLAISPEFQQQWERFRADHPYHIQVVALSKPNAEGHRFLVISEPPPHVTADAVRAIDPEIFSQLTVATNPIGEDGYVQDILIDLPRLDDEALRGELDLLHRYLFGTSYKANVVPIEAKRPTNSSYNLDIQVSAADLHRWLIDEPASEPSLSWWIRWPVILVFVYLVSTCLRRLFVPQVAKPNRFLYIFGIVLCLSGIVFMRPSTAKNTRVESTLKFVPVEGGAPTGLRQILEGGRSGVFESDQPGIVIWSVKRNSDIEADKIEAREFTLDSDLIVGAVAGKDHVAIVGRERVLPVDVLPPLRCETIFLLASANTDQLGQSYERQNLFAGKFDRSGNLDWAPIYLSRELIDTEYGSLLNVTDQMLKSWFSHGNVRYVRFKYPDPASWPFPQPLIEFAKTSEVTYNWNTKGTGYVLPTDGFEYYALNRTGALPVDYLAADNSTLRDAEYTAYKYFSARNDANLVRVVQYASLYQIFTKFGVKATSAQSYAGPLPSHALRRSADQVISLLQRLPDDVIESLKDVVPSEYDDLRNLRDELVTYLDTWKVSGRKTLLNEIIAPREQKPLDPKVQERLSAVKYEAEFKQLLAELPVDVQMSIVASQISQQMSQNNQLLQLLFRIPLGDIKERYEQNTRRHTPTWIRTPNVVVSQDTSGKTIGGHNLYARASSFRLDPEIARGEVHVLEENGSRIVVLNPGDADKATGLVRAAARDEEVSASELQGRLGREIKALPDGPVRSRIDTLFSTDIRPDPGRGLEDAHLTRAVDGLGFRPTQLELDSERAALVSILQFSDRSAVIVERTTAGKYIVLHSASKTRIEAADVASAQDAVVACFRGAVRDGDSVHLHLRGFSPEQGEGFIESAGIKLPKDSKALVASIDEKYLDAHDLADVMASKYDFKNIRIEEIPAEIVADGKLEKRGFDITADALDRSKPSLRVRIELFFNRLAANISEVMAQVRGVAEQWSKQLAELPDSADRLWALGQMRRELKALNPSGSVRVHLSTARAKDIYVGTNRDTQSTAGNSHFSG